MHQRCSHWVAGLHLVSIQIPPRQNYTSFRGFDRFWTTVSPGSMEILCKLWDFAQSCPQGGLPLWTTTSLLACAGPLYRAVGRGCCLVAGRLFWPECGARPRRLQKGSLSWGTSRCLWILGPVPPLCESAFPALVLSTGVPGPSEKPLKEFG